MEYVIGYLLGVVQGLCLALGVAIFTRGEKEEINL